MSDSNILDSARAEQQMFKLEILQSERDYCERHLGHLDFEVL